MSTTAHAKIRQKLEVLVEEVAPIERFEEADEQFIITVDGGPEMATHVRDGLVETGRINDAYTVELCRHSDTDEMAVRIVAKSLKDVEEEVTERINAVLADVR